MLRKGAIARLAWWILLSQLAVGSSHAGLIDFNDLVNGKVVDTQFQADLGVTISAVNHSAGPDFAIVFDSALEGTRDEDLEFDASTGMRNLLIVQENDVGCRELGPDDPCDLPDDEGSRLDGGPTAEVSFSFSDPIREFGFDLIDIEADMNEPGAVVFLSRGSILSTVGFADLPGFVFGNRSVNRVDPIDLGDFEDLGTPIDQVRFELGGSGAIDDVLFTTVPEPQTAALLALGLAALGRGGVQPRRRSRSSK